MTPQLPRRANRPQLLRESLVLALIASSLGAGLTLLVVTRSIWGGLGIALWLSVVSVQAILLFHDCMHQSAFGSRRLETWIARLLGAFYGVPFHFLRAEHLRHHRRAGLVDDDPEALHQHAADAAARPHGRLLARLAASEWGADALLYTWVLQLGQFVRWLRRATHDRVLRRATIVDVACMLALWAPLTGFLMGRGVYGRVLVFGFLLPALIGLAVVYKAARPLHTLMIPFRLDDMPYTQRQFAVARTFVTHPVLSLLLCNLNYHLEHHLYPHVSRWDLPSLSRDVRPALIAYARYHRLPLAIHDGYASWIGAAAERAKQGRYNPIATWADWDAHNARFAYVAFAAAGRSRDAMVETVETVAMVEMRAAS